MLDSLMSNVYYLKSLKNDFSISSCGVYVGDFGISNDADFR